MRTSLEIVAGPERGRTVRMASREVRQFGRTDWADTSFPHDAKMSQVHFSLETDGKICRIRDLDSSNGTQVNGEAIAEHVLADGDRIAAGETTFLVCIEGGAEETDVQAAKAAAAAKAPPPRKKLTTKCTVETCPSGVTMYRGQLGDLSAGHLIDLLARQFPLYLIVDFNKMPDGRPQDIAEPKYLFDTLPPEAAAVASPWVIAAAEYPDWFALVEKGWGEDAVVAFFSQRDAADVLAHLRGQAESDDRVVGICWPSVLAPLLSFFKKEYVADLLDGIDAVVTEFADFPDTWQIFGNADLQAAFEELGLQVEQPQTEQANSSNSE
ncbi:MAG: FHA domain-containing protein [Pirellulales bacterium]